MEQTSNYVLLGASGGIGSATSRLLASKGHQLFLGARQEDRLSTLASELGASYQSVDATDWQALEQFMKDAQEQMGRIDGLAVCVGNVLLKSAHMTKPEEYSEVMSKNMDTAFGALRAAAKLMKKQGGSIVLISSSAALRGLMNHDAIAAAKAGVIGLTLSAAASYAPQQIRVNCVAPGLTETPMTEQITSNERMREASEKMHALGRLGNPEDVARAIVWFLSPDQSWVSGQVLAVDGGLSCLQAKP